MSSPAVVRVQSKPKVYIAAQLVPDKIAERYKAITESFTRVLVADEADLIVVDLDDPPANLGAFFAMHLSEVPEFTIAASTPCLFVATKLNNRSKDVLDKIREIFDIEPDISTSPAQLLRRMKETRSIATAIAHNLINFQRTER